MYIGTGIGKDLIFLGKFPISEPIRGSRICLIVPRVPVSPRALLRQLRQLNLTGVRVLVVNNYAWRQCYKHS